jgi:winged helix-turn helix protein
MRPSPHRHTIVQLHLAGRSTKEIADIVNMRTTSVHRICKRYDQQGHIEELPKSGRPRTVNTSELRKKIMKKVRRNPGRSMRQMAREYKTSEATMRRIIKNDLQLFPYHIRKAHVLTPSMKEVRLTNARNLLKWAEGRSFSQVIFSDEKLFNIEKAHNPQNIRQLLPKGGCSTSKAAFVSRSAFPKSVMVWAGICSTGKTPLIFWTRASK